MIIVLRFSNQHLKIIYYFKSCCLKEKVLLEKYRNYILEFQNVLKNFSYTLIYQILALILPIVTVPYVTRILNQDLVGLNSIIQANCSYFELVGTLGINLLGPREIAKCLGNKKKLSETFFSIYKIQFLMHLIIMVIYIIYVMLFVKQKIAVFYLIYLLAYMFDISWLYIGLEDFKSVTVRNVFIRLLGFFLLIFLVRKPTDIYAYIITLYGPQILINIYMWLLALKKHVRLYYKKGIDKCYFIEAVSLFVPQIASSVYTVLDKTVLGIYSTYTMAAIYTQGQTLLQLIYAIVPSFCKVMAPRISNCIKRNAQMEIYKYMKMSCHVIGFISFLLFFGLLSCAKLFVEWYLPQEYAYTANVLCICSPIIIMVSGANLISIEYLIPLGKQQKYTISVIASAMVNLILNLSLTPTLGMYGVCIGSVVAESIGLFIQLIYVRKYLNLRDLFAGIQIYMIAGIIMFIVLQSLKIYVKATLVGLIIIALVGIIIYVSTILIIKWAQNKCNFEKSV